MSTQTIRRIENHYYRNKSGIIRTTDMVCGQCAAVIKNKARIDLALSGRDTNCPFCSSTLKLEDYKASRPLGVCYAADGCNDIVDTYSYFIEQGTHVFVPRENLLYFVQALLHYYLKHLYPGVGLYIDKYPLFDSLREYLHDFCMRPADFFIFFSQEDMHTRTLGLFDICPENNDNLTAYYEKTVEDLYTGTK